MTEILIWILVALITPVPQKNVDTEKLKLLAQELGDAMISGDHARAADLTYPKLVSLVGGRMQYIAKLKGFEAEASARQFHITSVKAGEPRDIIEVDNQQYAIVPTTTRIKVPEGILVVESCLIGISNDHGQNWTFVDSGNGSITKEQLQMLFGAAAEQLRLPEVKQPVLYKGPNQ